MHDKQVCVCVCVCVSCELPDAECGLFSTVHRVVLLHRRAKWSAKWSFGPGHDSGLMVHVLIMPGALGVTAH